MPAIIYFVIFALISGFAQRANAEELDGFISLSLPSGFEAIYREKQGSDSVIPSKSWMYYLNGVNLSAAIMDVRQQIAEAQRQEKIEPAEIEAVLKQQCHGGDARRKNGSSVTEIGPVEVQLAEVSATLLTSRFVAAGHSWVVFEYCFVQSGRMVTLAVQTTEPQPPEASRAVDSITKLHIRHGG